MPVLDQLKQLGQNLKQRTQEPAAAAGSALDRFKPYLLPAAMGAAAGGPMMAYFAGKNHIDGEDPKTRRHRILRNALLGLTLGGVAGGGIPAGLSTLSSTVQPMSGFHPLDSAANTLIHKPLPALAGGAGAALAVHRIGKNRAEASDFMHGVIGNKFFPPGANSGYRQGMQETATRDQVMSDAMHPDKQEGIIGSLGARLGGNRWAAREMMGEAGIHNTQPIREMDPAQATSEMLGLKKHLEAQGPVSRLVSKLVPSKILDQPGPAKLTRADKLNGLLSKFLPGSTGTIEQAIRNPDGTPKVFSPYRAAELYSKYVRPSIANSPLKTDGLHFGAPWLAAGVGGGMLGANYLQNKLEGN
jgi:hypothetical protein